MPSKIRVLIADDSSAVRRMLVEAINSDALIEVVAVATNGEEAVALFQEKKPDIVLLDVEMPVMDGIDALKQIRRTDRRKPVIMFSSLTAKGAEATLDALESGASDYVTKPTRTGHAGEALDYIRRELCTRIRELCGGAREFKAVNLKSISQRSIASEIVSRPRAKGPIDVVAIASSTGGPNALHEVLAALPRDFPVPVVIVQHMPPVFTSLLADRLNSHCALAVKEAHDGARLIAGHVWIAPGDFHMEVRTKHGDSTLRLQQGPPENSCRPAADVLFRSVAACFGKQALGVVLTGMGRDGTEGCRAMHNAGARIIAQDRESSVVWGMPGSVTESGFADTVLPLSAIGAEITHLIHSEVRQIVASASKGGSL